MDQPPIDNQTDFLAEPHLLLHKTGERLTAMVKATFELSAETGQLELAPEDRERPLRFADVPWGEPEKSSIAYPADVCVYKPHTDVVVVGVAHAPGGKPLPSFDVMVKVGTLTKAVRVYGLRVWAANGSSLSDARPTDAVEMRYDNAWGGFDDSNPERILEEARNPVGIGIARDTSILTHQPAPCIEDPAVPIQSCKTKPPPAGIGPIGRHWEPRRRYVGTYDSSWEELRAPLPPQDEDDRINQCASPGLIADPPLRTGEAVQLLNLVPGGGGTQFFLPAIGVELEFRVDGRPPDVQHPHLDTVIIDTLGMTAGLPLTVELIWRGSTKAPRRMKQSKTIVREVAPS